MEQYVLIIFNLTCSVDACGFEILLTNTEDPSQEHEDHR